MTESSTSLEEVFKRDRTIVLVGLAGIAILSWAYIFRLAQEMTSRNVAAGAALPQMSPWSGLDFTMIFLMWAVMMIAMMVPSAAPMILVFATINRKNRENQRPYTSTGVFLLGYLVIWSGFAVMATLSQWALHTATLLSPMMVGTSPLLGGGLLVAAGTFQWSRAKNVCLTNCRTPLGFLMSEWRDGRRGALVMGLRHGFFCLGCCWMLMALLFVLGVMNILWIAALAGFVLVERIAPAGHLISRIAGLIFVGWGAWIALVALQA